MTDYPLPPEGKTPPPISAHAAEFYGEPQPAPPAPAPAPQVAPGQFPAPVPSPNPLAAQDPQAPQVPDWMVAQQGALTQGQPDYVQPVPQAAPAPQPIPSQVHAPSAQPEQVVHVQLGNGMVVERPISEVVNGYRDYLDKSPALNALERAAEQNPDWWEQQVVPHVTGQAQPQVIPPLEVPQIVVPDEYDDEEKARFLSATQPIAHAMEKHNQALMAFNEQSLRRAEERARAQAEADQRQARESLLAKVRQDPRMVGQSEQNIQDCVFAAESAYRDNRHRGVGIDDCVSRWVQVFSGNARAQESHLQNQLLARPTGAYVAPGGEHPPAPPAPQPRRFSDGSWANGLEQAIQQANSQEQQNRGEL